jgi:uncharacterized membrane protein
LAIRCPNCGTQITPFKVKRQFACPNCAASLKSSFTGPLVATLIAWVGTDFIIYSFVASLIGSGHLATAIRILLSAAVGFTIYVFIISKFASVSESNEQQAP